MWRITLGLGLLGIAAWCSLLFGIGLDDIADHRTTAGVFFSLVVLPLILVCVLYALVRVVRPHVAQRTGKNS